MDYRQLFLNISDSLKKNSFINVVKDFVGSPVSMDDYSYQFTLRHFKITPFEKLMELYYSMSSCHIAWECRLDDNQEIKKFHPDDKLVSGQIIVRSIGQALDFDKKLEAGWWTKNLAEDEKADLYNFRYFDFNDDNIRVGFIVEDNVMKEEDFYFLTQGARSFFPVDLSFDDYLEKWNLYKGYQGWQENEFFKNTTAYKRMMHYVSELFGT